VGHRQTTLSVPLEWSPPRIDPRVGNRHPILYQDMRLGKELGLAYGGRRNVARYDTMLTLAAAAPSADLEAPTSYLRAAFSRLFGYDARTHELSPLKPAPFTRRGLDYTPASGWGGVIASDVSGLHAFAIYAATTSAGGSISRFTMHDFHIAGRGNGSGDVNTIKLRALRVGAFPAGTTRTTSYIVTGTLASVQSEMARLAEAGVK
jgi:hypothetical protein